MYVFFLSRQKLQLRINVIILYFRKIYCLCFLRATRVQAEYFPLNLEQMGEEPQGRSTGADGVGGVHGRPLGHTSLKNSRSPAAITGEFLLPTVHTGQGILKM